MSFEGIFQVPYANPLGNRLSAYQLQKAKKKSSIPSVMESSDRIDSVRKDHQEYPDGHEEKSKHGLTPEEQEQILAFAKLRGIINLAFEKGTLYRFQVNEATGMIALIEDATHQVILELSPEELSEAFAKLERYAGHVTDRCA